MDLIHSHRPEMTYKTYANPYANHLSPLLDPEAQVAF